MGRGRRVPALFLIPLARPRLHLIRAQSSRAGTRDLGPEPTRSGQSLPHRDEGGLSGPAERADSSRARGSRAPVAR